MKGRTNAGGGGGGNFGTNVWNKYASYTPAKTLKINFNVVQTSPGYSDKNLYLDVVVTNGTTADSTLNDLLNHTIISWKNYDYTISAKITSVSSATQATGSILGNGGYTYSATFYYDQSTGRLRIYSNDGYTLFDEVFYATGYTVNAKTVTRSAVLGELLGYIVSDDSSEYPNGGTDGDGFYYTLLGHVDSANVMSLSNDALENVQQDYRNQIETEVSNA